MTISFTVLLLIIGASLSWSGLDTFRKLLARRIRPITHVILLTLGQIPIFFIWVVIDGNYKLSLSYFQPGLIAVILNIIANLMFVTAVRISPFSQTIPFLSLTPVFATIMAIPILGEYPTFIQITGILIAVIGALNLNAASDEGFNLRTMWQAFLKERGSVLMTGVALLWSINSSVDKVAVSRASVAFHALVQCVGIASGLLAVSAVKGRLGELYQARPSFALVFGAVIFCALGLSLELTVIQLVPIRLVAIIKRVLELTMAMILGRLVFNEKITIRKLSAVGMMAVGIVIVLLHS